MNSSSPIIGTPLHVAVADNVPNRLELLSLLLSAGANPNLVIESDEGPPLRPVLAEYIASNDQPSPVVVKLLLRFGAKVQKNCILADPLEHLQHYKIDKLNSSINPLVLLFT